MCSEIDYYFWLGFFSIFGALAVLALIGVAVAGYQLLSHKPYQPKRYTEG